MRTGMPASNQRKNVSYTLCFFGLFLALSLGYLDGVNGLQTPANPGFCCHPVLAVGTDSES